MTFLIDNIYASKGLYQELLGPVCKKYNLTDSEVIVLLFLSENMGDTATDIVLNQRLKKSVVSACIKDLQDRGLIHGEYYDGNRRSLHLKLNEEAKQIVGEAKKVQNRYYDILTDGLSDKEKEELKSYLKKVNENIKNYKK